MLWYLLIVHVGPAIERFSSSSFAGHWMQEGIRTRLPLTAVTAKIIIVGAIGWMVERSHILFKNW